WEIYRYPSFPGPISSVPTLFKRIGKAIVAEARKLLSIAAWRAGGRSSPKSLRKRAPLRPPFGSPVAAECVLHPTWEASGPAASAQCRAVSRPVAPWLEVHAAHAAAGHGRRCGFLLRQLGDHRLGRDQQAGDGGRILESGAHHLHRIDDAHLDHVA